MEVLPLTRKEINPLIWEEIEEYSMSSETRNFLKELLLFERRHINEETPRYSKEYDKLIEKYAESEGESK